MRRSVSFFLLFLCLVLHARVGLADTARLIDSGVYVDTLLRAYWVNNDQLFFRGFDRQKPADSVEAKRLRHALYLWTVGDKPAVYAQDRWAGSTSSGWYCAENDEVWFAVRPESGVPGSRATHQLVGPPGRETIRPLKPAGRGGPVLSSLGNCERDYPSSLSSRIWAADTFKESYIDFGERVATETLDGPVQIVLKRLGSDDEFPLPIPLRKVGVSCTQFFSFSRTFLLWDCFSPSSPNGRETWRAEGCLPVWLVSSATTSTQTTCIPYGQWQGPIASVALTRAGLFFSSMFHDRPGSADPGAAGLYRLEGAPTLVVRGVVGNASVSPDGCKIAFSYAPTFSALNYGTRGSHTLVVMKLCQ